MIRDGSSLSACVRWHYFTYPLEDDEQLLAEIDGRVEIGGVPGDEDAIALGKLELYGLADQRWQYRPASAARAKDIRKWLWHSEQSAIHKTLNSQPAAPGERGHAFHHFAITLKEIYSQGS